MVPFIVMMDISHFKTYLLLMLLLHFKNERELNCVTSLNCNDIERRRTMLLSAVFKQLAIEQLVHTTVC